VRKTFELERGARMKTYEFDVVIVGGGIAGASAAAFLAPSRRVAILERESQPGYHSTGRSAALFSESYGNTAVRALSRASRSFLFDPPPGFAAQSLVTPRGSLYVARDDQLHELDAFETNDVKGLVHRVSGQRARDICPLLKDGYAAAAVFEPDSSDVDVHALHQGFLRVARAHDAQLFTDAEAASLEFTKGRWEVHTRVGDFRTPVVVNAAGAWADAVAASAGAAPVGVVPCRRTAMLIDPPPGCATSRLPLTIDAAETFYLKPDAGQLLLSPADETPSPPCDAQPAEIDIAIAVDRIMSATILDIKHIRRKWAGLRCFAPDRSPVVGFDPSAHGFFWLAGQGGYGIQTAPALGQLAAALIRREAPSGELARFDCASISPSRFHQAMRVASAS
jgi:D-arginine dehydrogenase